MHDSALSRTSKIGKHTEDTALKLKFFFFFKDQATSWIGIAFGVEKYVREAMPIQEEERALKKPAAKARPILKPSSTSNWNFVPVGQRKDPYCFQMSKFITQFLRHKEVGRKEIAGVPYDRLVEKCKEVLSEDSRYWSGEIKKLKHGSVLVQYCWKPNCPENSCTFSNSRSFRKSFFWKCSYQSCIARQCTFTEGFYQVRISRRKRKGIEVNSA